ncbi:MAG: radical SAM protein [Bacteroidales bacterium]|nr:radical SAM protein [Bacteroidales bacterium]
MLVNEIFRSLQGEGVNAGKVAVFVRFAGCNLRCPFCDTDHGRGQEMTAEEIVGEVVRSGETELTVLTGGEPGLQVTEELVELLHRAGKRVAIETNGTVELPSGIDWVTVSPKDGYVGEEGKPVVRKADELKVVYDGEREPGSYGEMEVGEWILQPCDTGNEQRNREIVEKTVRYCLEHPEWRLGLQVHKLLGIR